MSRVAVDAELLAAVMRAAGETSPKVAVELALRRFLVRRACVRGCVSRGGTLAWSGDLAAWRKPRR